MEKYYDLLNFMLRNIQVEHENKYWFVGAIHSDGTIVLVKDLDVIEVSIDEIKF